MTVKINKLEIENVKRVKAVAVEPSPNGLTIIGGKNAQGKTSVLDAIAWALGGEKYRPSSPQRDGSLVPPSLHVTLSNGLVVERKGRNGSLKVIDPSGQRAGQQLLNEFVEQLALDLPRFMNASAREKADTLLKIIGVGEELLGLEARERSLYDKRRAIGQIAEQKKNFADEMPYFADAPSELISASELIKEQQAILAKNGENQRKRDKLAQLERAHAENITQQEHLQQQIAELTAKHAKLVEESAALLADIETAKKTVEQLQDESTAEIEESISNIEEINRRVRANLDKEKSEQEAAYYKAQYDELTQEIEEVRKAKRDLLENANLPLPGLSVVDGELTYKGQKWDGMSGAEQLRVATAVVRKLNPQCGFVLLDGLERMDIDTLTEFGKWLETEGLQAIATRVSTGDECSIIIEDGYAVNHAPATATAPVQTPKPWKEGQF